ncbi:unnamed protein product [Ranitomeya imitator]|uniref:Protein Smaug homolog 1 n=1 Tax=Ranitomeya imitator TaxID=111125 RepID=A0ABN9LEZ6_9NEOB|nr:unnamed protein product [Ranitomeya imitator]
MVDDHRILSLVKKNPITRFPPKWQYLTVIKLFSGIKIPVSRIVLSDYRPCRVSAVKLITQIPVQACIRCNLALRRRVLWRTENELQSNIAASMQPAVLSGQTHHSPLKRSVSLTPPMNVPNQPLGHGWMSHEDLRARGSQGVSSDHAPLSPQSSVASSGSGGSEHLEDPSAAHVPAWLKSLRLHKYAALFSQMTYEEMMSLNECQLEAQNVTKGARHKIVISIQKLKERHILLKSLERDILEGGNLRGPLQELHQMILTPIKSYSAQNSTAEDHSRESDPQSSLLGTEGQGSESKDSASGGIQQHHMGNLEGESGGIPLPEGDLPGQFTRVMGKVCTQLLVSRPDEENISSYLQLIDKCLIHEAFTETQKKRLLSWKQQVQKLYRSFPRKTLLDVAGYRQQRKTSVDVFIGSRGFGQSNSLPTAGSVGAAIARRNPRQFQIPSRNLPSTRLGLLGPSSLLGATQRTTSNNPAMLKQGRQNLWFANPGGSNSMPSRSHSSVQRTRSLPVHTSPQTMLLFQQPATEPDINNRLESLCLSMTEHALSGKHCKYSSAKNTRGGDGPEEECLPDYTPPQGNLTLRRRVLRRTENELQSNIAASMQPADGVDKTSTI